MAGRTTLEINEAREMGTVNTASSRSSEDIGMFNVVKSRFKKNEEISANRIARRSQTSISTITVSRRRHEGGFKYCLDF